MIVNEHILKSWDETDLESNLGSSKSEIKRVHRCAYELSAVLLNLSIDKKQTQVAVRWLGRWVGHCAETLSLGSFTRESGHIQKGQKLLSETAWAMAWAMDLRSFVLSYLKYLPSHSFSGMLPLSPRPNSHTFQKWLNDVSFVSNVTESNHIY